MKTTICQLPIQAYSAPAGSRFWDAGMRVATIGQLSEGTKG
jgi:hypothetical protein